MAAACEVASKRIAQPGHRQRRRRKIGRQEHGRSPLAQGLQQSPQPLPSRFEQGGLFRGFGEKSLVKRGHEFLRSRHDDDGFRISRVQGTGGVQHLFLKLPKRRKPRRDAQPPPRSFHDQKRLQHLRGNSGEHGHPQAAQGEGSSLACARRAACRIGRRRRRKVSDNLRQRGHAAVSFGDPAASTALRTASKTFSGRIACRHFQPYGHGVVSQQGAHSTGVKNRPLHG